MKFSHQFLIYTVYVKAISNAFTLNPSKAAFQTRSSVTLSLSSKAEAADPAIIITGNNIEVTDALSTYVESKLEKTLEKFKSDNIKEVDVHMTVNKNPKVKNSHLCEVVTLLKGNTIHIKEETPDMYASIDLVSDRLARQLRKFKERKLKVYQHKTAIGETMAEAVEAQDSTVEEDEIEDDSFVDPEAPELTKIKSFDLIKPISVDEAIFALDYVDHDFYVFRDQDTNEVSVVYKRNAGGVGLIQPQQ